MSARGLQPHHSNARAGRQVFLPPPPPRIYPLPIPVRCPSAPPVAVARQPLTAKTGMTRVELTDRFAELRAALDEKSVTINATVPSGIVMSISGAGADAPTLPVCGVIAIEGDSTDGTYISGDQDKLVIGVLSGTESQRGTVVLSDSTNSSDDTKCGVAATPAAVSGVNSGLVALSGVVSGLKNFSKVTVLNSGGTTVTNGELTPGSNADDTLKLQAGSNVTLSVTSGTKTVKIDASVPVKDGKISGGSSLLCGTTIVIPVASTSSKGVTQLTDSVSNSTTTAITPNAVSGAISGVIGDVVFIGQGLATKVSGGSLHTALSGSGLANGVGSGNNTIYALINALRSVDGQSES